MEKKNPIKIVKRDARRQLKEKSGKKDRLEGEASAPEAAREMVATVTGWVNELKQKRRIDTAQALKKLFSDSTPQEA